MHKLKLLLFILSSLAPLILMAQPPGYLGKRASVNFTVSSLPVILGPTVNNRGRDYFGEKKKGIGFNYEFEGDFSYVVGRYRSLSLKVGQYYTGALSQAYTTPLGASGGYGQDEHDLFHRVNVKSIGIILSRFKKEKGALAPIGNRFYWGVKRTFISASIAEMTTDYRDEVVGPIFGHRPINIDQSMNINFLVLGWSNHQVFWDKLILKTGFRIAIPFNLAEYDFEGDSGGSTFTNQENFESAINSRVVNHELFRVDIGVGYLLF